MQCVDDVCQDPAAAADASTDATTDAGAGACGEGTALLLESFDGGSIDDEVWSIASDNASTSVVDGRLTIEPQENGASATVTTVASYPFAGTRLTIEMLPVGDISSSGQSVALVNPDTQADMAVFFRDTFDLFLDTGDGQIGEVDYDSVDHRFLRFEIEEDEIRFSASNDGAGWDLLATDPDAVIPLEVQLSIWVENYAGDVQPYRFDSITWCTIP